MKQFKIYENEYTKEIYAVKQGFTWLGFIFPVLWSLFKRHWVLAGVSFVVTLIGLGLMSWGEEIYSDFLVILGAIIGTFAASLFVGFKGNDLLGDMYMNGGCSFKETVIVASPVHAITIYMSNKNK
ncbi:DUF2628 domain-containing protein [Lonepinella sp. MS14436]|uniref:DUF2628 domain-containing protein n=1 Tax=Lonepinella sp. MS14436 TaxID=3003619 RepID=UPI0036D80574